MLKKFKFKKWDANSEGELHNLATTSDKVLSIIAGRQKHRLSLPVRLLAQVFKKNTSQ